jgi:hypothetical protein
MNRPKRVFIEKLAIIIFSSVLIFWMISADGAVFQGKVLGLQVSGNAVYFSVAGASYAECAKNKRYVFNAGTAYGRNLYLLIQDAFSANKEVVIASLGSCSLSPGDAEDIGNLNIVNDQEGVF